MHFLSCDVIISGQARGSKLQRVFALGGGCWPPTEADPSHLLVGSPEPALGSVKREVKLTLLAHVLELAVIHEDNSTKLCCPDAKNLALVEQVWLSGIFRTL